MLRPTSGGARTSLRPDHAGFAMSGNDTRKEPGEADASPAEDDLSARLKRLGAELDVKQRASAESRAPASTSSNTSAIGQAFRLSAEFVAGVIAGAVVGWLIDRLVGSSPWGLIVCLILGFCAGMLNLMRASGALKPARSGDPR